ncbi:MAG TPA: DEAD/DEAH box helicase [Firmicutes bacterium]|nr:DEAD/DEAH box helicase [Bacillota bacterium]
MSIDPIKATEAINRSYLNYLDTTFHLRDEGLRKMFRQELYRPGRFVKGPILEATPPFMGDITLHDLIDEGLMVDSFRLLASESLPLERPLYRHQEMAIRKIISGKRNIVVATGTGSGKTEIFMIPILNHLLKQKEQGKLNEGVRALLLYPMNALANDQLGRLRKLLSNCPEITFGRYTGETEKKQKAAADLYRKMFKQEPLPNEMISREQMWDQPPHILLTNYAMLEYLLLRPQDNVFFDGPYASRWRFLVLDEVHTYTGAKGIEIAMLLRRLKDRVANSEAGRLRCIATSATLGQGEEDYGGVALFANRLFGETFTDKDIIGAIRRKVAPEKRGWGRPNPEVYLNWQSIVDRGFADDTILHQLIESGKKAGIPVSVLKEAKSKCGVKRGSSLFIYEVLKGDLNLIQLQKQLEKEPRYLVEAAADIFPEYSGDLRAARLVAALVNLAVKARSGVEDQALLPARYHVFVRAIEGTYLSLAPQKQLFLARHEKVKQSDAEYQVVELAICHGCGAVYLVGEIQFLKDGNYFVQPKDDRQSATYLLPADTEIVEELDEDEEVGFQSAADNLANLERYKLCASCGKIDKCNVLLFQCRCEKPSFQEVYLLPSKAGKVTTCHVCGRFSPHGMLRRFSVGTDAAASVLATSLYQQIRPKMIEYPRNERIEKHGGWSSTRAPSVRESGLQLEAARKLLVFSDSRQDAAFFAPYFNRTYLQILRRNLIIRVLREHSNEVIGNKWHLQDLVGPLQRKVKELNLFPEMSDQEQTNEIWKWLMYELLGFDRRLSLEGLGLLGFALVKPAHWVAPPAMMRPPWNLSGDEVWTLFQVLLDTLRMKGAVLFPDNAAPSDVFFQPRNREYYFREHKAVRKKGIFSWSSAASGRMNARLDYLTRLVNKIGAPISVDDCRTALRRLWDSSLALENPHSCWKDIFVQDHIQGEGAAYRVRYNFWELQPGIINKEIIWFRCNKCHSITLHNIRGTCPSYRCDGTLEDCDPDIVLAENHYRRLYKETLPLAARTEEHTAQLTGQAAAGLQADFIGGKVNILSCSTTFELGVDVGELEAVFMRNVPPSAANYVQRAGRAGRRTDSTAFTLTFAQRRSHDLNHFAEPWRMVAGKIGVPYFKIANEKVVRRHLYAVVLAAFWKRHADKFGKVANFFLSDPPGPVLLQAFIEQKPDYIKRSLIRIVPPELREKLQIDNWGWVDGLLDNEKGVLAKAYREIVKDIEQLQQVMDKHIREQRPSDYILRLIRTLKRKPLLDFLSSRNVIPKYGFPVDVVELLLTHHGEEAQRLELQRDLRIALSEYAPSSEVVAGGKLWTSRYIKRSPKMQDGGGWEWERFHYAICDYCQSYTRSRAEFNQSLGQCANCGNTLTGSNRGTFIVPDYGFIASWEAPATPGERRPEKTYATRIYYSGDASTSNKVRVQLKDMTLAVTSATHGKLAIINNAGKRKFKICTRCGYTLIGDENVSGHHTQSWGGKCDGTLYGGYSLGHEFETDLALLIFEGYQNGDRGFWYSLLYALLEGCSEALDIERQDLDGVLYHLDGNQARPAIVIFDDVPGGAGHAHRIAQTGNLKKMLDSALLRLERCDCGGNEADTSCYGCLRHYRNQFCHELLNRRKAIDFLKMLLR